MELKNYGTHTCLAELLPTHSRRCHQLARLYEKVMKCGALIYCSVMFTIFIMYFLNNIIIYGKC